MSIKTEMKRERDRLIFWREYAKRKNRDWKPIERRIEKLDARLGIQEELFHV